MYAAVTSHESINNNMFLTACCHACHPSNHLWRFCSSDGFELALSANGSPCCVRRWASWICTQNAVKTFIYNFQRSLHNCWPGKGRKWRGKHNKTTPNHRDADSHGTNIITWPLCLVKYGRSFAVEFLLYKLRTWQIRTGLRSQTTSAIITNHMRSPGNTSPVRIGLFLYICVSVFCSVCCGFDLQCLEAKWFCFPHALHCLPLAGHPFLCGHSPLQFLPSALLPPTGRCWYAFFWGCLCTWFTAAVRWDPSSIPLDCNSDTSSVLPYSRSLFTPYLPPSNRICAPWRTCSFEWSVTLFNCPHHQTRSV